ncbi:hypothetical protein TWF694_004162 [Orbilia ellipsospora]|uniref:Transmembrane protein n=1 Tax=Orbilia ellipsospora TaxID=2528407 RepID=A0AAV9WY51_9PEZI
MPISETMTDGSRYFLFFWFICSHFVLGGTAIKIWFVCFVCVLLERKYSLLLSFRDGKRGDLETLLYGGNALRMHVVFVYLFHLPVTFDDARRVVFFVVVDDDYDDDDEGRGDTTEESSNV